MHQKFGRASENVFLGFVKPLEAWKPPASNQGFPGGCCQKPYQISDDAGDPVSMHTYLADPRISTLDVLELQKHPCPVGIIPAATHRHFTILLYCI
jgi:hypothetical protein